MFYLSSLCTLLTLSTDWENNQDSPVMTRDIITIYVYWPIKVEAVGERVKTKKCQSNFVVCPFFWISFCMFVDPIRNLEDRLHIFLIPLWFFRSFCAVSIYREEISVRWFLYSRLGCYSSCVNDFHSLNLSFKCGSFKSLLACSTLQYLLIIVVSLRIVIQQQSKSATKLPYSACFGIGIVLTELSDFVRRPRERFPLFA